MSRKTTKRKKEPDSVWLTEAIMIYGLQRPLERVVDFFEKRGRPIPRTLKGGRSYIGMANIKYDYTVEDYTRAKDYLRTMYHVFETHASMTKTDDTHLDKVIRYTDDYEVKKRRL